MSSWKLLLLQYVRRTYYRSCCTCIRYPVGGVRSRLIRLKIKIIPSGASEKFQWLKKNAVGHYTMHLLALDRWVDDVACKWYWNARNRFEWYLWFSHHLNRWHNITTVCLGKLLRISYIKTFTVDRIVEITTLPESKNFLDEDFLFKTKNFLHKKTIF